VGFEVSRLLRIRFGPFELPRNMRPGTARLVDPAPLEHFAREGQRKASP
jgi:16S rRNA U516 pseudouridylate synthase RsuA-like enzyme